MQIQSPIYKSPYRSFFIRWMQHNTQAVLCLCTGLLSIQSVHAKELSYAQAEQQYLNSSYSTMAHHALQQASDLEAQAVKHLGMLESTSMFVLMPSKVRLMLLSIHLKTILKIHFQIVLIRMLTNGLIFQMI